MTDGWHIHSIPNISWNIWRRNPNNMLQPNAEKAFQWRDRISSLYKNWNLAVKILQNDHLLDSMSFLECAQGNWISKTYFPHVNRQNPNMNDSFTRKYLQILHIKCMHLSNLHGELKFSISPFIRIVSHNWNFPFDESKILSTWITIPQT